MKWTPAQHDAITARGQNLLINAGAGAGKTAALIQRIFSLIADPNHPVSIDEMLIVTFTRAAAAEMKGRLAKRLREEVAHLMANEPQDEATHQRIMHFERQMLLIPRAQVSTIDSFCLRIVRENADRIGLPPDVELMDETEAMLLHREKLGEVVDRLLEEDGWKASLGDLLASEKPSEEFRQLQADLISLHGFLAALEDPHAWASSVLATYEQLNDPRADIDANPLYCRIKEMYLPPLRTLKATCDEFLAEAPLDEKEGRTDAMQNYVVFVHEMHAALHAVLTHDRDLNKLRKLFEGKIPKRPSGKSDIATALNRASAPIKPAQDAVRDLLLGLEGVDSFRDLARDAARTLPFIRLLLGPLGVGFLDELLEDHKHARRLTFAQVARLAIEILHREGDEVSDVAEDLRREFQYLLVDEYQDVSGMQARLLRAVSRPGDAATGRSANQFVVGDVKQSIYGFRQADPSQFLDLYDSYARYDGNASANPGARIDFRENFRSAHALINELNALFAQLFSKECGGIDYDESQQLVPGRDESGIHNDGPAIALHLIDVPEPPTETEAAQETNSDGESTIEEVGDKEIIEAERIADLIEEQVRDGRAYGDFAILLRSARNYAALVIDALQARGIPYFTQAATGFLHQQEIKDVTALLRAILNPYDDVALVGALRGPAFAWNEDDIARLRLIDMHTALFDNMKQLAQDDAHPMRGMAAAMVETLRHWQAAARREGMGRLFTLIYSETAIREKVATLPNGAQRLANLVQLQEYAIQFDSFRRKGIGQFLLFFEDLLDRDEDLDTPSVAAEGNNCVQIMTVHKSKGLQFKVVIVPFLAKQMNEMDQRARIQVDAPEQLMAIKALPGKGPNEDITVPAHAALVRMRKVRGRSEELRLLYVALTRAEERLILTASARDGGRPGMFVQTIPKLFEKVPENDAASLIDQRHWVHWLAMAWRDRIDWEKLFGGEPVDAGDNLAIHYEVVHPIDTDQTEIAPLPVPTLTPEYQQMLDRVVEQANAPTAPPIRVKATATAAKRAYEAWKDEEPTESVGPARPHWSERGDHPDWWPEALRPKSQDDPVSGALRGTMTHRYFALVDLVALRKGTTPADELARMVGERLFTEEEAALIRMEQVQDFFADGIGQRVLANHATVRRELPFVARFDASELLDNAPDPNHPLILQGVVDLYFEQQVGTETHGVIVDFKTDRTDGSNDRLDQLERDYSPQLVLYREGLARALGRPVHECWLYFLTAKQSLLVDESRYPWRAILGAAYCSELLPPQQRGAAG